MFAARHDPVAVNGTVLTVVGATSKDITVKNPSGRVATLPWKAFSDDGGPVRIAPGFAATIDSQQGITSTEHINAMLGGSAAVQGLKNYVAESRHRNTSWMVVNEAAERRQISQGQHIGTPIDTIDVWKNIAANLSAQPVKASALDFLREATQIRRGAVSAHFRGRLPGEQRQMEGRNKGVSVRERIDAVRPEVAAIAAQLRQLTQQAGHIVQHQMHKVADRTRGHRP